MLRRSRRTILFASLSLVLATTVSTLGQVTHPEAANASVTTGDLVFATGQFGDGTEIAQYSGGTVTDLTATDMDNGIGDQDPAVSPDGSRIAYQSLGHATSSGDGLYVMNSDGSAQTQLTSATGAECGGDSCTDILSPQAWSPDGTQLVFGRYYTTEDGYTYEIDTVNADGTDSTTLLSADGGDVAMTPSWSPDGTQIAYTYYDGSTWSLYVMDANGDDPHQVLNADAAGYDFDPVWSPDGSEIYFDNSNDIFSVDTADYDTVTQLTYTAWYGGHDFEPTVSPDGSTIAFTDNGDSIHTISASANLGDNGTVVDAESGDSTPAYVITSWTMKYFTVIGDSFSSGYGNSPYISPSGTDGCDRSFDAYGEDLNASPVGLSMTAFVACSGATSSEVLSGLHGESDQLDSISSSDNIVILTVGGDDIGFQAFVTACVLNECAEGSTAYTNAIDAIDDPLPSNLATLFSDIASTVSSGTRVLVLGYPDEIPPSGASWLCSGLLSADQTAATAVTGDLNAAIDAAVTSAGSPFEYVDPYDQFYGHDLCASSPYFNDVNYHPNIYGQAAYAQAVVAYLAAHPTAP